MGWPKELGNWKLTKGTGTNDFANNRLYPLWCILAFVSIMPSKRWSTEHLFPLFYHFINEKGNLIPSTFSLNRGNQQYISTTTCNITTWQRNISYVSKRIPTNFPKADPAPLRKSYTSYTESTLIIQSHCTLHTIFWSKWMMPEEVMLINFSFSSLLRLLFKPMRGARSVHRFQLLAPSLGLNKAELLSGLPRVMKNWQRNKQTKTVEPRQALAQKGLIQKT